MKRPLLWLALVLPVLAAQAQPVTPDDFARGMTLEVRSDAPLQAVVLPRAVYQTAVRADLGDVRVFNGGGEELPHAIDRRAAPLPEQRHALPFFPLRGRPGSDLEQLTVQVRRAASGALVEVDARPAAGAPVRAYLVDASRLDAPLRQLTFTFADTAAFVAEVVAETSDDLSAWAPWGAATLASLRYGGNLLRRDVMPLPARRARYVRLSWTGDAGVRLDSLVAVAAPQGAPEGEWARLEAAAEGAGVYRFDQQGVLPVERVRFELPQVNTLARVELASAAGPEGPWQPRYRGRLYRLRVQGHDLSTPPVEVPRTTDRYWRLVVEAAGGGLGQGRPVLVLGWTPERLLFVPRGAAPYTLAFGSARVAPAAFDPDELLRLLPGAQGVPLAPALATAGPDVVLGGAARLAPPPRVPWTRLVLWGVLLLGVALLATMSVRLLRQIDRDRSAGVGEGRV